MRDALVFEVESVIEEHVGYAGFYKFFFFIVPITI